MNRPESHRLTPERRINLRTQEVLGHELRGWPMIHALPEGNQFRCANTPGDDWLTDGIIVSQDARVVILDNPKYVESIYDRGEDPKKGWQPIRFRQIWIDPDCSVGEIKKLLLKKHGLRQDFETWSRPVEMIDS